MKIISKFKDYYDFIAAHWGGGDPKIIYVRKDLVSPKSFNSGDILIYDDIDQYVKTSLCPMVAFSNSNRWRMRNPPYLAIDAPWVQYNQVYLCVAGKSFLCLETYDRKMYYYGALDGASDYINKKYFTKQRLGVSHWTVPDRFQRTQMDGTLVYPELVDLCRKFHAPVFFYRVFFTKKDGNTLITVRGRVPILSNVIGLPGAYPPEQIYQDLSYFMANTINGSPDLDCPVKLTDKERIAQHGFDLVTSFRGQHDGNKKRKTI